MDKTSQHQTIITPIGNCVIPTQFITSNSVTGYMCVTENKWSMHLVWLCSVVWSPPVPALVPCPQSHGWGDRAVPHTVGPGEETTPVHSAPSGHYWNWFRNFLDLCLLLLRPSSSIAQPNWNCKAFHTLDILLLVVKCPFNKIKIS